MAKDLYEALGISRTATEKEIRSAYRRVARKFHPDVNPGDKASESRFKEINAANEVLSDPDKRKKYDKYGDRWEHADQIEDAQRRQSAGAWASGAPAFGSETGDFGSIFENLFRRERSGPRGQPPRRRGQDVEVAVETSLEEAFAGTTRQLSLETPESCRTCNGTGQVAGAICHSCEGYGQVARPRRIEVKVPAGVKTGSRVRVAGEGRPGSGGGPNGDLYLVVSVQLHATFERRGDDLVVEVPVPYLTAILGGEVEVGTLDGRIALRIPELTQNGRQIRLAGKGMPVLGEAGKRGDLYVRVRAQLPERLTDEERAALTGLREARVAAPSPSSTTAAR